MSSQFLFRNGDGGGPGDGFLQDEKDPQTSGDEMLALSETELDYRSKYFSPSHPGQNGSSPWWARLKPHNHISIPDLVSGESDLEDLPSPTAAGSQYKSNDLPLESSSDDGEIFKMSY